MRGTSAGKPSYANSRCVCDSIRGHWIVYMRVGYCSQISRLVNTTHGSRSCLNYDKSSYPYYSRRLLNPREEIADIR